LLGFVKNLKKRRFFKKWVSTALVCQDANMTSILVMELTETIEGSNPDGKQWYC